MDIYQKNVWRFGSMFLIVVSVFFIVKIGNEIKSSSYIGSDAVSKNVIHAQGTGKVFAKPDIATFSFSITAQSKVVADAQKTVSDESDGVVAFLKGKMQIDEKDIETTNYSIAPHYVYDKNNATVSGYDVTQSLSVKLRDVTKTGDVLSGIGALGVSDVSGPIFSVDKQDDLIKDARTQAINNARADAQRLSHDLGVTLVRIVDVSESFTPPSPGPIMYAKAAGIAAPAMAELPTGQSEIVSQVTITYEIR